VPLELTVLTGATELEGAAADRFLQLVASAQARGEHPHVVLTGGSISRAVH
jgi:hypothetical protein